MKKDELSYVTDHSQTLAKPLKKSVHIQLASAKIMLLNDIYYRVYVHGRECMHQQCMCGDQRTTWGVGAFLPPKAIHFNEHIS